MGHDVSGVFRLTRIRAGVSAASGCSRVPLRSSRRTLADRPCADRAPPQRSSVSQARFLTARPQSAVLQIALHLVVISQT
jgi:hypothetical protein